jgi:alkanesulfonate monooxygenase SsuD/methylene tetrahydromethanopterin reductase-like flavin-dependent oxidoreductase (luciferase family)
MLSMVARYADLWNGWLLHGRSHVDEVPALQEAVDAACEKEGRDPATLARTIGIAIDQREASLVGTGMAPGSIPMSGTPEDLAEHLTRFAEAGIDHVQVTPMVQGVAGVEALAPVLELLDQ